jgi:hypothetical protein
MVLSPTIDQGDDENVMLKEMAQRAAALSDQVRSKAAKVMPVGFDPACKWRGDAVISGSG